MPTIPEAEAAHEQGEKVEHRAMKKGATHEEGERIERKTMRQALRKTSRR